MRQQYTLPARAGMCTEKGLFTASHTHTVCMQTKCGASCRRRACSWKGGPLGASCASRCTVILFCFVGPIAPIDRPHPHRRTVAYVIHTYVLLSGPLFGKNIDNVIQKTQQKGENIRAEAYPFPNGDWDDSQYYPACGKTYSYRPHRCVSLAQKRIQETSWGRY